MRAVRTHLTYANVTATLALCVALAGGTAFAAGVVPVNGTVGATVGSLDIIDGQVLNADIAKNQVNSAKIKDGTLTNADVLDASLTGADVNDGSVTSADLAPSALGARAYGLVSSAGDLTRSKNISLVDHIPGSGFYCIFPGPGIVASTAVLIVAPDFNFATNATSVDNDNLTEVEWDSVTSGGCSANGLLVRTFAYYGDGTDDDDSGGNLVLPSFRDREVELQERVRVAVEDCGRALFLEQLDVLQPVEVLARSGRLEVDLLDHADVLLIGVAPAREELGVDRLDLLGFLHRRAGGHGLGPCRTVAHRSAFLGSGRRSIGFSR